MSRLTWEGDSKFELTGSELLALTDYVFAMVGKAMNQDVVDPFTEMVRLNEAQKTLSNILAKGKDAGSIKEED